MDLRQAYLIERQLNELRDIGRQLFELDSLDKSFGLTEPQLKKREKLIIEFENNLKKLAKLLDIELYYSLYDASRLPYIVIHDTNKNNFVIF